jgi:hypothetical protein
MIGIPGDVSGIKKGSEVLTNRNVGASMAKPMYASRPIEQPLKLRKFAAKQAQELGEDASKIIGEGKEGLPLLLYHRIGGGKEPFQKFILKSERPNLKEKFTPERDMYDYISTGLSREGMRKWTHGPPSEGLSGAGQRIIIGMGKVNKLFDYDNPEHVEDVMNFLWKDLHHAAARRKKEHLTRMNPKKIKENYKMKVKTLDRKIKNKYRFYGKQEVNPAAKDLEIWEVDPKDYFIYTELPKGHPEGSWFGNTSKQLNERIKEKLKNFQIDYDNLFGKEGNLTTKRINRELVQLTESLKRGSWQDIEDHNIQHALKNLGYDSFTTKESGKNVMLFNPNEQFIPLFDPLKKSAIGFSTGGGLSDLGEK